MSGYLTPEIEKVIPMLSQTCDDLIRQELIRALTAKTQEWCEGDPELAELILEKKKSLEGCVRYVMGKAAEFIAKNISAMSEEEIKALPKQTINGQTASMAGGVVGDDQAYEWAKEYYYNVKESDQDASKAKATAADTIKKNDKKAAGKKSSAKPDSDTKFEATPKAGDVAPETKDFGKIENPVQMNLFAA